jgi:hypothetical protein
MEATDICGSHQTMNGLLLLLLAGLDWLLIHSLAATNLRLFLHFHTL